MGTDSSLPTGRGQVGKRKGALTLEAMEQIISVRNQLDNLKAQDNEPNANMKKAKKLTVSMDKLVKQSIGKYQSKIAHQIHANFLPDMVTG